MREPGVHTMWRWCRSAAAVIALLISLAILSIAVLIPRLGGATPYTVLTSSMQPKLPPGTLVVVKPAKLRDLSIGMVITYQLRSGKPEVVTHRIVAQSFDDRGRPRFRTQGDANPHPDPGWVRAEQIKGTTWYSVPHVGRISTVLNTDQRQTLVYVVAALLGLYAVFMVLSDVRDRSRARSRVQLGDHRG